MKFPRDLCLRTPQKKQTLTINRIYDKIAIPFPKQRKVGAKNKALNLGKKKNRKEVNRKKLNKKRIEEKNRRKKI